MNYLIVDLIFFITHNAKIYLKTCDLATPQVNMKPDSFTFPFDQQIASTLQYCSCTKILYKYR